MIDSGSRDRSVAIARSAGVELLQIAPGEFAHGRTRNLGAERTSGELICFLTQDATPCPGWLSAYREAFALADRVGAAFGPHRPRPETSPMIARELTEFFAAFSPDGRPAVQRRGEPSFLSNVNACYSRACWEEVRFREVGLLRGPGLRRGYARGRMGQGLPPGCGRPARPRLPARGVHAPLLRRVPRPARDERSRRGLRAAECRPRGPSRGGRRPALDERAPDEPRRAGPLERAGDGPSRRPQGLLGAGRSRREDSGSDAGRDSRSSARSGPSRSRRQPAPRARITGTASPLPPSRHIRAKLSGESTTWRPRSGAPVRDRCWTR